MQEPAEELRRQRARNPQENCIEEETTLFAKRERLPHPGKRPAPPDRRIAQLLGVIQVSVRAMQLESGDAAALFSTERTFAPP